MPVIIRPVIPDDAPAYNAYRRRIADEPNNTVTMTAGEYTRTVEQEHLRIVNMIADPDQYLLLAVLDDGEICGQCMCRGEKKSALRHAVSLGIDVAKSHRGQGIGHQLMGTMLNWARRHPRITRVELDVFATNRTAISLYIKHGFTVEGCKRRAYFKDGAYIDAYVMSLLLD